MLKKIVSLFRKKNRPPQFDFESPKDPKFSNVPTIPYRKEILYFGTNQELEHAIHNMKSNGFEILSVERLHGVTVEVFSIYHGPPKTQETDQ
jgi:hypothetical protein